MDWGKEGLLNYSWKINRIVKFKRKRKLWIYGINENMKEMVKFDIKVGKRGKWDFFKILWSGGICKKLKIWRLL